MEGTKVWQIIAGGAKLLEEAGVANEKVEAALLLCKLLGWDSVQLLINNQLELTKKQIKDFYELIKLRQTRYPLQYITGIQEFMGFEFKVSPDVLIPRGDTEVLVESVLDKGLPETGLTVVDVGTGSGAIAVSLAKFRPYWQVYATDASEAALRVASENSSRHGVEITFLQGNLLEPIRNLAIKPHIIVSNPPYIAASEIPDLMKEVLYEPRVALDGGIDGLEVYRKLIPQSFELLQPGGSIFLEIGSSQGEAVAEICADHGFNGIEVLTDYQGLPRVVFAMR
ncbi:MAG: peptide chain release factor N(5)-glutamine methyltransferase [Bacillota bacterium]